MARRPVVEPPSSPMPRMARPLRLLFVHQNCPGQFVYLVQQLAAEQQHDIVFITEPNTHVLPGVRRVEYKRPALTEGAPHDVQEFELAIRRAEAVAGLAARLNALGFRPDLVIGHEGWGEMLYLPDVWPDVPRIGYQEFFYHAHGLDVGFDPEFPVAPGAYSRIRVKNAVNLISLSNGNTGISPTNFQRGTYPDWARPGITLLSEGVDLQRCAPAKGRRAALRLPGFEVAPGDRLVTYVARDLEPYRGFHVMMRAAPAILARHPDAKIVLVGGDGVSYGGRLDQGSWRDYMLAELGPALDRSRVCMPGKIEYGLYLDVLRRSDAHVYLTYPFVASWSLREALAVGCAVIASDTAPVHEFITDGQNGLLTPCLDPARLADQVGRVLGDADLSRHLRRQARARALQTLDLQQTLRDYRGLIGRMLGIAEPTSDA